MKTKGRIPTIPNRIFRYISIFLIAGILLGGCFGHHADSVKIPTVEKGVMDLRGWNFAQNGPISLDGEWEFYWEQLLTPADFARSETGPHSSHRTGMIRVPGSWQGYLVKDGKLTGDGYATYRVRLLLPDTHLPLGFNIPQLYTAYQLWADGQLIASAGKVGSSRREMIPQYIPKIVSYQPTDRQVELVIRVSNFHHRRGGIWRPIQLGLYDQVKQENNLEMAFGLLVMGSFFLMAFYNLNLYFYLKKDLAPLLLSIFFGIGALRSFLVGQVFYTRIFPDFNWELAMKLEYFTFYFCGPVFYRMLRCLYPAEIPALFIRLTSWTALIFAGITILTPARVFTHLAPVFQLVLLGSVIYMAVILGLLSVKRKEYLMISVFAVIFLSLFNDVLFYNNLNQAEFPTIPIIEGFKDLPFLPRSIPFGLISMFFFIFIFNLLTLKMTQHYFTKSGFTAKSEIAAAVLEENELTPREAELIRYLIQGYSNKQIAAMLSITEGTVKSHLHKIYQKTGVKNRTELSHLMQK